jgi:pimeloyl-ACP methyl ester carboxylesterase
MSLPSSPPAPFRDRVQEWDLALHGEHARAFVFDGCSRATDRAVVCISGMGANGRSFARQRPLAGDHFLLPLNLPMATPPEADPLQFSIESVEEFLNLEKLDRPVLMGSSFGGAVAASVALRNPDRLGGLVLVSGVVSKKLIPYAFPGFVNLMEAPDPLARLFSPLAAQIMGGFDLDRAARDELVRESRHYTTRELKRRLQSLFRLDLLPQLASLRLPTLVVHGRRDWLVPWRRGKRVAETIHGAQWVLMPKAGHLPYLSEPEAFNDAVKQFLDGLSMGRRGWAAGGIN